ncbi:MAG TPA: hypothetical protein V6C97_04315 [Oculatellaceae cyanobacterium]
MNSNLDTVDSLVDGWHNYFGAQDAVSKESNRWALNTVCEMLRYKSIVPGANAKIRGQAEVAWTLILKLVETAPTRASLIGVAVFPLRLIMHLYFEEYIDRVKDAAIRSDRFAYALSHVELWNEKHHLILRRLARRAAILTLAGESEHELAEESKHVCDAWFQYFREQDDEFLWAVEKIPLIASLDPNRGWDIILSLLSAAESTQELFDIGSLVGDLLQFSPVFTPRVEEEIRSNWRCACALSDTYLPESIKPQRLITLAREYTQKADFSQFGLNSEV